MSSQKLERPAVIILTKNEELNLPQALESVHGWAPEIWILDGSSKDRTLEIAARYGCKVAQEEKFVSVARERNYALRELPIESDWVFFLDADEWLPQALKDEIDSVLSSDPKDSGFLIKRRFYWMGRWIKRGYYPVWLLRLFRKSAGFCEERSVNEHLRVRGTVGRLKEDFIHEDHCGVDVWVRKHLNYARCEAEIALAGDDARGPAHLFGDQAARTRWIRAKIWNPLPLFLRPLAFFFYRYILRGGFLEGLPALSYHVLSALWYPMLIDLKIRESRRS